MAQANQLNLLSGSIKALLSVPNLAQKVIVSCLSGTTRLPIFASTVDGSNGFSGSITGVTTIGGPSSTTGNVVVRIDEGGTVTRIVLPLLGFQGSMSGSATPIAFTLNGCSTIETSAANVLGSVEINFTVADVR